MTRTGCDLQQEQMTFIKDDLHDKRSERRKKTVDLHRGVHSIFSCLREVGHVFRVRCRTSDLHGESKMALMDFWKKQEGTSAGLAVQLLLTLHGALIPMPRRAAAIFPIIEDAFDIYLSLSTCLLLDFF